MSHFARAIKISTGIKPLFTTRFNVCAAQGIRNVLGKSLEAATILLPLSVVIQINFFSKPYSEIRLIIVCAIF